VARFILEVRALTIFHFMLQLITISDRCHRFPGFVYRQARFSSGGKSIEIAVSPRVGSKAVCSGCHQPAPGYDRLAERRFEFIPFGGFLVFLLYSMRRVDCPRCQAVVVEEVPWGDGKRTLTRAYMYLFVRSARADLAPPVLGMWCAKRPRAQPASRIFWPLRGCRISRTACNCGASGGRRSGNQPMSAMSSKRCAMARSRFT